MSRTDPQLKVRLPLEMKEELEKAAKENHRSMNAEIVSRLGQSLGYVSLAKVEDEQDEPGADEALQAIRRLDEAVEEYLKAREHRNRVMHGQNDQ